MENVCGQSRLRNTRNVEWNHVPTEDNPADCASRGVDPSELKDHALWFHGPNWLKLDQSNWPKCPKPSASNELEVRTVHLTKAIIKKPFSFIDDRSSYTTVIRVMAFCIRFYHNCQPSKNVIFKGELTVKELNWAKIQIIKLVQAECFWSEIKFIEQQEPNRLTGAMAQLGLFLDADGLLRVGGRLHHANVNYKQKHPILLPQKHRFTTLFLDYVHKLTLHGGVQLMVCHIREQFWLINARNIVRQHVFRCTKCFRLKAKPINQIMGDLPDCRVTQSRCFLHTGVDFAGPIEVKTSSRRNAAMAKGYISVFVCMATKAIHLELVHDLTTAAFIAALRRFTSRRGLCSDIYSDQGTNFKGASNELPRLLFKSQQESEELSRSLANDGIQWHFIPPHAPHFGGLWEAGVKSTKHHLRRIMGDAKLTFEEISTILTQIESCLNSRPICPMTNDVEDFEALTPGHFLIGTALKSIPHPSVIDVPQNRLTRWQRSQQMVQHFWNRWSKEYLNNLQQKTKWNQEQHNINIGNIVLIKDDNLPPNKWNLGRIEKVHPGHDGKIRVVTIRAHDSSFQRPIAKVCLLPIQDNQPRMDQ